MHGLNRQEFLKIFNLYHSLSFITIFKRIHKDYPCPLGNTPGISYRQLDDIKESGIDMDTLRNDAFPQLRIENTMFVTKLFEDMELELDLKSRLLKFDPFIRLIKGFHSSSDDKKLDRFFALIDNDDNGHLSYKEITNLVLRSLKMMQDAKETESDR
jgi:Ca2+-binding EF-hand superfamily protein